ncbi:MAG: beta-lactamase family protein [Gammaproteobacteria bacterium]|nr:beta-lactamase family protein [Gammaproteobacteria bacterium]
MVGFIAAFVFAGAAGQELPRTQAEAVGMLEEGLHAVAAEMDRLVADGEIVGMNAMIARRGRIVFEHATGILDMETGAPMRLDSLIRIYSMTKPITSAGALMLVDDGKLDLDEPVTTFFPEWKDQTAYESDEIVPVEPPVTARHLLLHTSGLSYGYVGDTPVDRAYRAAGLIDDWDYLVRDTNTLVEKLADIPLLFQPGTRWHYSFSTDVLGQLIERVSGKPLDEYLEERMFGPLGMTDSYFDVPPDVLDRFGTDHEFKDGKFVVQDSSREDPEFIGVTFLSGGGGLVMPTESYLRFCQAILNGGELNGVRILQPETVALMTTDQLPPGIWPNSGFGLGFAVVTEEGESTPPGSYSWGGAAGTFFWIDPGNELIAVFMPQYISMPGAIQEKLKELVYAAID